MKILTLIVILRIKILITVRMIIRTAEEVMVIITTIIIIIIIILIIIIIIVTKKTSRKADLKKHFDLKKVK